jgi:hypothetical protein
VAGNSVSADKKARETGKRRDLLGGRDQCKRRGHSRKGIRARGENAGSQEKREKGAYKHGVRDNEPGESILEDS